MNLAHWLERSAAVFGDRPAIALGTKEVCGFRELAASAARGAAWLAAQGLVPGDRVGFFLGNHPDTLRLLWSTWWAGLVAVPIDVRLHGREAAFVLSDCTATLCFADAGRAASLAGHVPGACRVIDRPPFLDDPEAARSAIVERQDDDDAWLAYPGGTAGPPRGARLAMRNLRWAAMAYLAEVQAVAPGDVMLHPAPLSQAGGLYHLSYLLRGGVSVLPAADGFDAGEIAALARHWRNASFFATPGMVRRLLEWAGRHGTPVEGLATVACAGALAPADIEAACEVIGPHFARVYGHGGSTMSTTVLPRHVVAERSHPRHRERLASVGYAQPMVRIEVRAPDGGVLPAAEPGEVCVRGDVVTKGYWNPSHASAEAVRGGWLHTGDIGALDADGFLTLLDRGEGRAST